MTDTFRVTEQDGRVRFGVRVQPRAARNELVGAYGDAVRIRLTAPPVDGAANEELVKFLANTFAVSKRSITIVSGASSRSKIVEIAGLSERAVRDKVAGVATTP